VSGHLGSRHRLLAALLKRTSCLRCGCIYVWWGSLCCLFDWVLGVIPTLCIFSAIWVFPFVAVFMTARYLNFEQKKSVGLICGAFLGTVVSEIVVFGIECGPSLYRRFDPPGNGLRRDSCRRSNRLGLWLAATSQNYLSLLQNPELGTIDVGTKARQGEPIKMSVLHVALRFEEALFKKLISLKNETGLKGMAIVLWRHTGILVRC